MVQAEPDRLQSINDVADFAAKMRLIEQTLVYNERKVLQKRIAIRVFPEHEANSAETTWSDCKRGKRPFPAARCEAFFRVLNEETGGLFRTIDPDTLLERVETFGRVLLQAKLIERFTFDWELQPLSERIGAIGTNAELLKLLQNARLRSGSINEYIAAILRLPDGGKEKIGNMLCELLDEFWQASHVRSPAIASAIIQRMPSIYPDFSLSTKLERRLERSLTLLPANRLSIVKPLCYICFERDSVGPFIRNIERLITDAEWRAQDYVVASGYYGGLNATIWQLLRHCQERALERRCQDVGRVIVMLPSLLKNARFLDLAAVLEENTMKSLAAAGVRKALREQVENLIHSCGIK